MAIWDEIDAAQQLPAAPDMWGGSGRGPTRITVYARPPLEVAPDAQPADQGSYWNAPRMMPQPEPDMSPAAQRGLFERQRGLWEEIFANGPTEPQPVNMWPDAPAAPEADYIRDAHEAAALRNRMPFRNIAAPGQSNLGPIAESLAPTEPWQIGLMPLMAGPGLIGRGLAMLPKAAKLASAATGFMLTPEEAQAAAWDKLTGAFRPKIDPIRGNTRAELELLQKQTLTPEEQQTLQTLGQQYPKFGEAARYLHPTELQPMLTPERAEQMTRLIHILPKTAEMASVAKAGAPKQGWYRGSTQALIDVFGQDDAPRFAALLAATSPQNSVEMNLLNSLNIWKNWTAAGRPTDPRQIKAIMGASVTGQKGEQSVLDAWVNNTRTALTAADPLRITLSGPKVDSFFRNLADDVYRVTNDAWMSTATGGFQGNLRQSPTALQLAAGNPGMTPAYGATSALIRRAGESVNQLPQEAQETIWSFVKALYELQEKTGIPARELLQKGMLTPEIIKGTPDFATLLKLPEFRQILEGGGYGSQIDALRPIANPHDVPALTIADQNNLLKMAKRLEELKGSRELESRSLVSMTKPKEGVTMANATWEQIPGRGTGHLEKIIDTPYATRLNYSAPIAGMFADPHGRSILHQNLGFDTVSRTPATGAFKPEGAPLEINPVQSYGFEVGLKGKMPMMTPYDQTKAQTANAVYGSMTGQLGTPFHALSPDATGTNLFLPFKGKATPAEMGKAATKYAGEPMAFADTGKGTSVLDLGPDKLPIQEQEKISKIFGGRDVVRARSVADDTYFDLEKAWKAGIGSRKVTKQVQEQLEKLKPSDLKKLDQPNVRQIAGDLYDYYEKKARTTKDVTRPDLMNYLKIIRDSGLAGLKKALADPNQLLPVIGALGLTGVLSGSRSPQGAEERL